MSLALDSWAVLRYLEDAEPTASRLDEILQQQRPVMSWINVGEVYYVIARDQGEPEAEETRRDLRPKLSLDAPTEARVVQAARLKAHHAFSYADAFAAATAMAHQAVLLTGDPELLQPGTPWSTEDLRG